MRASGVRSDLPALLHNLGYVALHAGELARARALFVESLALHRMVGNHAGMAEGLYGLAAIAAVQRQPQCAARLFGAARAAAATSAMPAWSVEATERTRYLVLAQAQMTTADWADLCAMGARQPFEHSMREAIAEDG